MTASIPKIILITGDPGVGKTTLIRKLFIKLSKDETKKINGFYTEELRDASHTRIGFDVINLKEDKRAPLARLSSNQNINWPKVGKYSVDLNNFEKVAIPIIKEISPKSIYLIDEVGKMESFSKEFERSILNLLQKISDYNILLIATVPSKSLSLADKLKSHNLSKLYTVTFQNRNKIIDDVYDIIIEAFSQI